MKKFFTISGLFLAALIVFSAARDPEGPVIGFDREVHEFGEIHIDSIPDGKIKFTVYNKGSQPLVLTNVRACCGTRVNGYTEKPIAPADSGYVEVEFRIVNRPHRIGRTVTIQSNATNRQTAILRITGEVVETGEGIIDI